MFNIFRKKSISDVAKDFESQFKIAIAIMYKYLNVWLKQIFSSPEYIEIFADKPDMHATMSAEILKYLMCLEDTWDANKIAENEQVTMAKKYTQKWADDVMARDKEFSEFVILTLRMELALNLIANGEDWPFVDPTGKKIMDVLQKYDSNVIESPDPKKYTKVLRKWIKWDSLVEDTNM